MSSRKLHQICSRINIKDNGGEGLSLTTSYLDNGDDLKEENDGIFLNQELTLQSYCNSATFNLVGAIFTPEILRDLADRIEQGRNQARIKKLRNY